MGARHKQNPRELDTPLATTMAGRFERHRLRGRCTSLLSSRPTTVCHGCEMASKCLCQQCLSQRQSGVSPRLLRHFLPRRNSPATASYIGEEECRSITKGDTAAARVDETRQRASRWWRLRNQCQDSVGQLGRYDKVHGGQLTRGLFSGTRALRVQQRHSPSPVQSIGQMAFPS
jgi:hypothetical protein